MLFYTIKITKADPEAQAIDPGNPEDRSFPILYKITKKSTIPNLIYTKK